MTAPGWYDNPDDDDTIRFYDGHDWTQRTRPKPHQPNRFDGVVDRWLMSPLRRTAIIVIAAFLISTVLHEVLDGPPGVDEDVQQQVHEFTRINRIENDRLLDAVYNNQPIGIEEIFARSQRIDLFYEIEHSDAPDGKMKQCVTMLHTMTEALHQIQRQQTLAISGFVEVTIDQQATPTQWHITAMPTRQALEEERRRAEETATRWFDYDWDGSVISPVCGSTFESLRLETDVTP